MAALPRGCFLLGSAVKSTEVKLPSLSNNSQIILEASPFPLPSPPSIVIKYILISTLGIVNYRYSGWFPKKL